MEVGRNNKHWCPLVRCRHTHALYMMTLHVIMHMFSFMFVLRFEIKFFMFIFNASLFLHVCQYYSGPTLHIMHTYYIYPHMYVHLCLNVKLIRNPYVLWSCWPRSPGAQREKEAKEAKAKAVGVPKAVRIYTYGCFRK